MSRVDIYIYEWKKVIENLAVYLSLILLRKNTEMHSIKL